MNIIFASQEDVQDLATKYVVLELDTFRFPGTDARQTAWALVEQTSLTLQDLPTIDQFRDLHNNLMHNYRLKNWSYCEQALEHLLGKWKGELDTFYDEISRRVQGFKETPPSEEWDGTILRLKT